MPGDCGSRPILGRHAPAARPARPHRDGPPAPGRPGSRDGRAAPAHLARRQGPVPDLRRALRALPPLLEPRLLPLPALRLARAPPHALALSARPDRPADRAPRGPAPRARALDRRAPAWAREPGVRVRRP